MKIVTAEYLVSRWEDHGEITGFLDFELTERNVRIFDPCYEMTTSRAMELAKYLYENGIEPDSALDILADFQVLYREYETFIAAS